MQKKSGHEKKHDHEKKKKPHKHDHKHHDHDHQCDHDHEHEGTYDIDEEDLEDMFVQGPAGMEWGGPTRGGKMPEVRTRTRL